MLNVPTEKKNSGVLTALKKWSNLKRSTAIGSTTRRSCNWRRLLVCIRELHLDNRVRSCTFSRSYTAQFSLRTYVMRVCSGTTTTTTRPHDEALIFSQFPTTTIIWKRNPVFWKLDFSLEGEGSEWKKEAKIPCVRSSRNGNVLVLCVWKNSRTESNEAYFCTAITRFFFFRGD